MSLSLSPEDIARLSRMSPSQLQVEFGRALWSFVRPRLSQERESTEPPEKGIFNFWSYQPRVPLGKRAEDFDVAPGGILKEAYAKELSKRVLVRSRKRLKHVICVKFDYCKKRTKYKDETDTAIAVGGLISGAMSIPIGIGFILALYLSKKGLNKFCKCESGGLKVGTVG